MPSDTDSKHLAAPVETDVVAVPARSGGPRTGVRHMQSVSALSIGDCHVIGRLAPAGVTGDALVEWVRDTKSALNGQAGAIVRRLREAEATAQHRYTTEVGTVLMPSTCQPLVIITITRTA